MRITESGNIRESLITDRVDKVFYDDIYVVDERAYDIALYVQFRSETDHNDILTYKILFYEDYNKSSDDMRNLVVSLKEDVDMDTCDKAVKEYGNKGWVGSIIYSLVNKLVVADLDRRYITVNVQGHSTYYRTLTSNTFQNLDNCLLFKCYYPTDFPATDGIMYEDGHLRIYSCDIYDNGTQIRQFRPYLNAGKGGMLDELNNVWYGNNGTGEFLYN